MWLAIRSLWIWAASAVLIVSRLPGLALLRLFDRDPALYRTGLYFRGLGPLLARVNPSWRVRVTGVTIEDPRRPYVVVSNHQSMADIPLVSHLPFEMKWIGKESLFRVPIMGWLMRLAGDIPLDRGDRRKGAKVLLRANYYLQHRCSVMFFPEGTRSRDGRVGRFNDGAFLLAIRNQLPVLPLALDGSLNCLPKHSWIFGAVQDIHLHALPPVDTTGLTTRDVAELRERVRSRIIAQIAHWRGVPPGEVDGVSAECPTAQD